MPDVLHTFTAPVDAQDRARIVEDPAWLPAGAGPVTHRDGSPVPLAAFADLMANWADHRDAGRWSADRAESDRWLAPRVHWALRLTRAQAGDRQVWLWLALQCADYVRWRWDGDKGVTEDRWTGAVNKQAIARLWWGGELFRDGSDYRPVVRAFVRQDLPNSYLHRPFLRCRPLALALLEVAAPEGREEEVSADDVNDLARVVNLATAGAPPEAEVGYAADDVAGYVRWVRQTPQQPFGWDVLPDGPSCVDTTAEAMTAANGIARRCAGYARTTAEARCTRSSLRRRSSAADSTDLVEDRVGASPYAAPEHESTGPLRPEGIPR
ncbi:DUF6339 family protein [Actinotalea sp. Marseille-Q4924]|uniref:DUF6339 family protein n=1 Tax=Actinotalea sp. Marseille-Q4924 TaxID=2866571 RepID=UPI001CE3CB62|nr:DUF6339 family protein [Actinotalea sp. Marseille-Q4924]